MKVNINRQLAGLEDIAFGTGTVMQERQGGLVEITKVNLGNLPFSETLSAAEVLTPIYEQVVPHMVEILEADTNAAIAAAKAVEASDSAAAALASEQAAAASEDLIASHLIAEDNPHSVTKTQVGLSNVDNTSDLDKPVSTAQQLALDNKSDDNAVMHLVGDETTTGIKTFLVSPIVPDATTPQQPLAFGQVSATTALAIHNATLKSIPDDSDEFVLSDSAASFILKKLTWADLKAALSSFYVSVVNPIFTGSMSVKNTMYKDTPVTITSWSYVTTTITLNVASHTFVAGDYIEVSGLTATTNIPNGVHLVTSVTTTTIVFTYAVAPTGTAGVSSATVKGYMTTNGRVESIGVGQTWQDVTTSRALQTTYTNSTGKPIMVFVTKGNANNTTWQFYINGVSIGYVNGYGASSSCVIIVPNGATYMADNANGALIKWMELR